MISSTNHIQSSLNIQFLNCNSIYNKTSEIKLTLQNDSPEIFCMTETWINPQFLPKFPNYCAEWKHRNGRGGGIGILIRNNVQYEKIDLDIPEEGYLEAQAIKLYIKDSIPLSILNLYNPVKDITYGEFEHYLNQLGDMFVIVGDFNAHSPILNTTCTAPNHTGKSLEKLLQEQNICLMNPKDMYTYTDRRSGKQSCLDLCFASANIATMVDVVPYLDVGSDHLIVKAVVDIQLNKYLWLRPQKFRVTKDGLSKFRDYYIESKINLPTDINSLVEDYMSRFTDSSLECFGKPSSGESKTNKRTPWWNDECHQLVAQRRKALKTLQNHPTLENLINFKKHAAKAKYVIKKTKKESMQSFVSSLTHRTPQGTIWKKIKAFKSTYSPPTYPLTNSDGLPLLEPQKKAEALNHHFLQHSRGTVNGSLKIEIDKSSLMDCSSANDIVNIEEIEEILSKLAEKAPGYDKITNSMIKNSHENYKTELLNIINQSMLVGEFPKVWKYGVIVPIQKPGKPKESCSSYRPITLLSCFGKILERVMQKRLEIYMENNKLMSHFQYGFRPGKGTEDVVLRLRQQIQSNLKNKKSTCVVYFDLKGAFDGVWREGLLYKASVLGVCGHMLRWLSSYLVKRSQSVQLHGYLSRKLDNNVGVPQGAVLSPILFNMMMADFPTDEKIETYVFADDITVACSGKETADVEETLRSYLVEIDRWFQKWKFTLNHEKTKAQFFTRRKINKPSLSIGGKKILNM